MIKFRCDACGQKLGVPDEYAGKRVKCTQCAAAVRVPSTGRADDDALPAGKPPTRAQAPPPPPQDLLDELEPIDEMSPEAAPTDELDIFEEVEGDDLEVLEEDVDAGDEGLEEVEDDDLDLLEEAVSGSQAPAQAAPAAPAAAPGQQIKWGQPPTADAAPMAGQMAGQTAGQTTRTGKPLQVIAANVAFITAMVVLFTCLVLSPIARLLELVGLEIANFGLLLVCSVVGLVASIIGLTGVKKYPGQGLLWRSLTGLIIHSLVLLAMFILLVIGVAIITSQTP